MNTFYVKYTYNRILFSPNREENSDISYDMDESGWHYAKDTHTKIQMLYDSTSVRYLEQSNSEAEREQWLPVAERRVELGVIEFKEETELSLFTDDMIVYTEDLK